MKRLENYALWAAIFSFIPLLLEGFGLRVLAENYTEIWTAFLGILVIAGILNNPSLGRGYKD
ncbi:MAG: hypothetical protein ACLKAK_07380 [Alkaliphilus sp.]